jgi:hypothetical protein
MNKKYALFLFLIVVFLAGCSKPDFTTDSYRFLGVSKEAYDSSLNLAGDLYKQEVIGEKEKEKAIQYGNLYMATHNQAVAALLEYELYETDDSKRKYIDMLSDLLARLSFLTDYVANLRGE